MDTRALHLMKTAGISLVISLPLVLAGVGCGLCGLCAHGAKGPEPEELAAIAAVLNKTTGPLTVTISDPAATDVLEPDEAIFYALTQSRTAREFDFQSDELTAPGRLLLLSGGEMPAFVTGSLTVRFDEADETLTVASHVDHFAFFGLARAEVGAGSTVFLLLNATSGRVLVGSAGRGLVLPPDEHTAIVLDEGDPYAVTIEAADQPDTQELLHVFQAPRSEEGEISAFIAFITLQDDELVVATQPAEFRKLE